MIQLEFDLVTGEVKFYTISGINRKEITKEEFQAKALFISSRADKRQTFKCPGSQVVFGISKAIGRHNQSDNEIVEKADLDYKCCWNNNNEHSHISISYGLR